MSPGLFCGLLVPIAKEYSLQPWSLLGEYGGKLKHTWGYSRAHSSILPPGMYYSVYVPLGPVEQLLTHTTPHRSCWLPARQSPSRVECQDGLVSPELGHRG